VSQVAQSGTRPRLSSIQAPVLEELDGVGDELRRIVLSDFDMIEQVSDHMIGTIKKERRR